MRALSETCSPKKFIVECSPLVREGGEDLDSRSYAVGCQILAFFLTSTSTLHLSINPGHNDI